MRFRQNRSHSIVTAKNFTIAMVVVNAAGLLAVQQKLKQAEIPNAYALDAGEQTVLARSDAVLPDRRVLPEIALTKTQPLPAESLPALPAFKPLPVIDLASLDLVPVAPLEQASAAPAEGGIAIVIDKPAKARPAAKRRHIAVPSLRPAQADNFDSAFGPALQAPPQVGLTVPSEVAGIAVGADSSNTLPAFDTGADVEGSAPADLAPPAPSLTAPTLAPEDTTAAPAAPTEEAPAELPAAA